MIDTARTKELASKYAIVLVLAGLVIGIGLREHTFLSLDNLSNILRISSVRVIIALGVGGILITRGTDLSAGRTVGLCACIAASLMQRPDYASKMFPDLPYLPLVVPIVCALAAGLLVGLVNGLVVAYLKVPPFITTLGTMVMVYGACSLYVDRPPRGAMPIGGLRDDFANIGTGSWGGIPILIVIAAVVLFMYWILLNWTRFGKHIYAIGGNPEAARLVGIPVRRVTLQLFLLLSVTITIAAIVAVSRLNAGTNSMGTGMELYVIAAAVIGGVSLSGGSGTVLGSVLGALIIQFLDSGLLLLDVGIGQRMIIIGQVLIVAVAFDVLYRRWTGERLA